MVVVVSGTAVVVVEVGAVVVDVPATVVVVVGGATEPFPQQPMEAFQCFQPPLE